jgi:hypothetical protein
LVRRRFAGKNTVFDNMSLDEIRGMMGMPLCIQFLTPSLVGTFFPLRALC